MEDELNRAMAEKYYHSQGAVFYEEGRYDEAARCFLKALALDDRPYIRHHLGLSYMGKGDLDGALKEMTRAVDLAPLSAEYRYERSMVWRRKGDGQRADEDYRKAVQIDANYARIGRIRDSAGVLEKAFLGCGMDNERLLQEASRIKNEELRAIADGMVISAKNAEKAFEGKSCIVPCPAYCCHFSHEPVVHGLMIGAWKLQAIEKFLREKGLQQEAYVGALLFDRETHLTRLIPPDYILRHNGGHSVFYPRRTSRPLGTGLLRNLPKGMGYRELVWITQEARTCAFLDRGRCIIHDMGGDPALSACKEFLCLTGFVFLILAHLGLVTEAGVQGRTMADLNGIAVEAVLLLADRIYANEEVTRKKAEMQHALEDAVFADLSGDDQRIAHLVKLYRIRESAYLSVFSQGTESLGKEIPALLI